MKKVAVIGSGNVGATAALFIARTGLADVVLVDVAEGIPQGKALDLAQSAALLAVDISVTGSNDFADVSGADIVLITAGMPRKPGMSRTDLLQKNADIVGSVIDTVTIAAPAAIIILVTNPLDAMVNLAYNRSGRPKERLFGMGGLLDSSRMRFFLSRAAGVPLTDVDAMVIGAHGDEMVPLMSLAKIAGRPAEDLLSAEQLSVVADSTRGGGGEIVSYLKTGSAFYAPGAAAATMVEAVLSDKKSLISTCAYAGGEFGLSGLYLSLPAVIGAGGVERIVELDISAAERKALALSAESVRASIRELELVKRDN